jgi:2-polyprenyl-3-methyl-5-hydroxy-6-metoxy-1,4-benzoquinol methylase
MPRRLTPELMDNPNADPAELAQALAFIRSINRRMGGTKALLQHLERWSKSWPKGQTITLLDVATGSADLPIAAARWAHSRGLDLRITAIDIHDQTLSQAQRQLETTGTEIRLMKLDALSILDRFGPKSFDYVHAGLFLHHLSDQTAIQMLDFMRKVARQALIWNDLVRSPLALAFIRCATLGRSRMIRHDATVSVEAGFTRAEAIDIAHRAGMAQPSYSWSLWTHRFTLTNG